MRKFLATIFATGTLAVGATAPVIPNGEMEFVQAVQYDVASLQQINVIATSTESQIALDKQKEFAAEIAALDRDKNGIVSMATFKDTTGELYEVQIPDALYRQMGERDGFSRNPKKTEYQSVFRSLVPKKASAAIAFDASTQSTAGSVSSLTYAHTTSGSNRILFVASNVNTGATVSGITYNGTSLTLIDTKTEASGPTTYLHYLIAPSTGANNVVITASGSTNIVGTASSYTGAAQSGQPDASTVHAGAVPVTAYSKSLTTSADNSWVVSTTRTGNGLVQTADAGTTIRQQPETTYIGGGSFWDSGGPVTPAGSKALGVTVGADENFLGAIMASFSPAADAPPPTEDILWFFF